MGAAPPAAAPEAEAKPAAPGSPAVPPPHPAAPQPSVRVRTETLDRLLSSVGEVILASSQLRTKASGGQAAAELDSGLDRMDRIVGDLQRRALRLRTAPLLRVVDTLPRTAREVASALGKQVEVELRGAELELDRAILDRLADPLVHLVRNAVDHGIEDAERRREAGKPPAGRLVIDARRERDHVRISVADDGRGIDLESVRRRAIEAGILHADLAADLAPADVAALVFRPGVSTATAVSEVSGRGVGMDAVKSTIEGLGGRVELESRSGLGTTTTLLVPITAALQRVLLVELGDERVAIPIAKVERVVEAERSAIEEAGREAFTVVDDQPLLVIDLAARLGIAPGARGRIVPLVLTELREQRVALLVDRLDRQQEIYVKPLPRLLASARGLAGLTVLGDGRPVFLLDLNHLT
jgi:two-component system chemotaxis sensor kinase CheA